MACYVQGQEATYAHVALGPLECPQHTLDDLVDLAHAVKLLAQGGLAGLGRVEPRGLLLLGRRLGAALGRGRRCSERVVLLVGAVEAAVGHGHAAAVVAALQPSWQSVVTVNTLSVTTYATRRYAVDRDSTGGHW